MKAAAGISKVIYLFIANHSMIDHFIGMENESIISTFIYYYDSDNIEDTTLNFRHATSEPDYHHQDDIACMDILYQYSQYVLFKL